MHSIEDIMNMVCQETYEGGFYSAIGREETSKEFELSKRLPPIHFTLQVIETPSGYIEWRE